MSRQARKLQPRWRRPAPAPQTVIQVRGRSARHLSRELRQQAAEVPKPSAFRFRYQVVPFAWGIAVTATGLGLHLAHARALPGILTALAAGVLAWLGSRHLSAYARKAGAVAGALTALWLPLLAAFGPRPSLPLFGACWAAGTFSWVRHYRIRAEPGAAGPTTDEETWARLAEHKRWHGQLGPAEKIPGGVRYPLLLDGVKTHIGDILSQPMPIAGAWHKSVVEAYAEPSPDRVTSRGYLTLLKQGTLENIREWDGCPLSEDGIATVGRFGDGARARIRIFANMDGTRHALISGTSGAGKSSLLDLLLCIMLSSGFVYPVILDPQEGQSLPDWRGRLPYAAGVDECMDMLDCVHSGMLGRSRLLSRTEWVKDGRAMPGMKFFDRARSGLPIVALMADEAHMLLTGQGSDSRRASEAVAMLKEIGKLGRKTGVACQLVTQVPSLEELNSQTLRSMLAGGSIISLRTQDRVSAGMLGLLADPSELPQYFRNGDYTYGLGYVIGPDNRQAIARIDKPSDDAIWRDYKLPDPGPAFTTALARFGQALPLTASQAASAPVLAAVDDSPAPGGQTARDAILAVLDGPMDRGDILAAVAAKAAEWGRGKAWTLRAVTGPLADLLEAGQIAQEGKGGAYRPVRPSLSLIGGQASQGPANAGNQTGAAGA